MTLSSMAPLEQFPLDESVRMGAVAWGLTYPGEIVRASRWQARWGAPLDEDLAFRLVLTPEGTTLPSPQDLQDDGIAVFCPATGPPAVREAQAAYAVAPGGVRVARPGDIVTGPGQAVAPLPSLDLAAPEALGRLLQVLLTGLYLAPPIDLGALEPLDEAGARLLWEALTARGPRPRARAALRYLRGLGLEGDAWGPAPIAEALREAVQAGGLAGISLRDLKRRLLRQASLPPYLTTLYVLVAVLRSRWELELTLASGRQVNLLNARLQAAERIGAHLLAGLAWTGAVEESLATVAPSTVPTWRTARPYLQILFPEGTLGEEPELADRLRGRRAQVTATASAVDALVQEMGRGEADAARDILARVDSLLSADAPVDLVARARSAFLNIADLAEAMDALSRIEELAGVSERVRSAWRYLQEAILGGGDAELAVDRRAVLERMALRTLLASPALWPSVEEAYLAFRSRYARRYAEAHAAYWQETAGLHERLRDSAARAEALGRLNAIGGLGPALAPELPPEHATMSQATTPCTADDLSAVLAQRPLCPSCGFTLTATPPTGQVRGLLQLLDRALQEQQRRLGSQAVRQVLARGGLDRLDRFLQSVQAADVAALTSLLDDELVAFIERLLQASPLRAPQRSIFERLQERYPTIGAEDVNLAAAELARLLRSELEEAQRETPDQPVRLPLW